MPQTEFSTKARTLAQLYGRVAQARVVPLHFFTVRDWRERPEVCRAEIIARLGPGPYIVRSSCRHEDGPAASNAGTFVSVPNVSQGGLAAAVGQVVASYRDSDPSNEVLVQRWLVGVIRSGVAFSHDPNSCSPYRVVNWSEGDDTATVTGGQGGRVWQAAARSPVAPPSALVAVVALVEELVITFGGAPIDLEFAVTRDESGEPKEQLWLLQVRPLILTRPTESDEDQERRLGWVAEKVQRGMQRHPFLKGKRTVYAVMPDWNPAEIVGVRPKPLALTLYRELITDAIWAYQRHNYGYRNLRSFPLMPHFFGSPYIDVRLSFNSFIPADLDEELAGRLVDHYIDRLLAEPTLHDKVEFEIVFSCYTLDLPQRLARLLDFGFHAPDLDAISESLRTLTNRIVDSSDGIWRTDARKLDTLKSRREELLSSDATPLERIYWLIEDAKRFGTLPFAGLARAGFVAVQMLRSLVSVGVLSVEDCDAFLGSISTVSGQLARDRAMLDRPTFLARYGHLRPGTYDIVSPRYDEAPDLYFDWNHRPEAREEGKPFAVTLPQLREIGRLLHAHKLQPDVVGLLNFIQAGIEYRELSKFEFTRSLSDALSLIGAYGERLGFDREDMAFCDIRTIQDLYVAALDPRETLKYAIERGRRNYRETLALTLPPVIASAQEVWAFEWPDASPNFITQRAVTGLVALSEPRDRLRGAVVCIPSADPGFDWLFACEIGGLITAWGGANSHMAIRAGELGLPAVIGAGEINYKRWSRASRLHVDCAARRVEVLA